MTAPLYNTYWYSNFGLANYLLTPSLGSNRYQPVTPLDIAQRALWLNNWARQQPSILATTLTTLGNYARQLWEASQPLQLSTRNNVFLQRAAASSAPNSVTAQATPGATLATYTITIDRIATAQQNLGTALTHCSCRSGSRQLYI